MVKSRTTGTPEQRGLIVEVRSADGSPPYVVRWLGDDHLSTFFPGSDAIVLTPDEVAAADERERARFAAVQEALAARDTRAPVTTALHRRAHPGDSSAVTPCSREDTT